MLILLSLALFSNSAIICQNTAVFNIPFSDKHITYEGRIMIEDAAYLYWPGSGIKAKFFGRGINADLQDEDGHNFIMVIIDGRPAKKIAVDAKRRIYVLAKDLPEGHHLIEIFKATQANKDYHRGYVKFYGFSTSAPLHLKYIKAPKRYIEFYGNSITCGHSIEDTTGSDSGAANVENNYYTYAAITARHFNAGYTCIAQSGIGLIAGFRAETMPQIYDRINPFDKNSLWHFQEHIPGIVVVNLFQNDAAVINNPNSPAYKKYFASGPPSAVNIIAAYQAFIQKIRNHYPHATIICVLGNMGITRPGSPWPSYVTKAVENLQDTKILTHFFHYKGTPKHPILNDHITMANNLINFIKKHVKF